MALNVDSSNLAEIQAFFATFQKESPSKLSQGQRWLSSISEQINDAVQWIKNANNLLYGSSKEKNPSAAIKGAQEDLKNGIGTLNTFISKASDYIDPTTVDMYNKAISTADQYYGTSWDYESTETAPVSAAKTSSASPTSSASMGVKSVSYEIGGKTYTTTSENVKAMIAGTVQPNRAAIEAYSGLGAGSSEGNKAYLAALKSWRAGGTTTPSTTPSITPGATSTIGNDSYNTALAQAQSLNATNPNITYVVVEDTLHSGTYLFVASTAPNVGEGLRYQVVADQSVTAPETTPETTPEITPETTPSIYGDATNQSLQDAIDWVNSNTDLTPYEKQLYLDTVAMWDPNLKINLENIIVTFKSLKDNTIDPYYQQQIEMTTADLQSTLDYNAAQRATSLKGEQVTAAENIRTTKSNLEQSGMTFTGEARRQLGAESAYQQDTQTDTNIMPFEWTSLEGLVPEASRLTASSSQAAYEQSQQELGQQAEAYLGSTAAGNLISGYTPASDFTGSLENERVSMLGSTLTDLYNQELQNYNATTQGSGITLSSS